jgi:hypothetical protein
MVYTTRAASREDAPLGGARLTPLPFPNKLRQHNLVAGCNPIATSRALPRQPLVRGSARKFLAVALWIKGVFLYTK